MSADERPSTPFAHASEAEMARILDFYAVRWEYEPHTFPILWNLEGDVVESFSPDFYLPDLDLYLEMTTLRQKLVRKKNRKLRRLRELYPDINIKLFYARDFRALMLKYGKLALFEGLSGTSGQVASPYGTSARARRRTAPLDRRRRLAATGRTPPVAAPRPVAGVAPRPLSRGRRKDRRSAMTRSGDLHDDVGRDPPDRGRDRGQGARARAPGSAPTTPAGS